MSWEFEHAVTIEGVTHGWADAINVLPDRVVLVDFKFGWLELNRISATWQMAAYSVGLEQEYKRPVKAYVYCPRSDQIFECPEFPYHETLQRIQEVIAKCKEPDAPLNAKPEACKYCKARGVCPELNRELELVVQDRCALTPAIRAKRRDFLELVESWAESVREDDRKYLLGGGEIQGWELRKRLGSRVIPDAGRAWAKLKPYLTSEEMLTAVKVEIGKLEKVFCDKEAEREGSRKSAESLFSAVLGDAVERKHDYYTVVRTKGD